MHSRWHSLWKKYTRYALSLQNLKILILHPVYTGIFLRTLFSYNLKILKREHTNIVFSQLGSIILDLISSYFIEFYFLRLYLLWNFNLLTKIATILQQFLAKLHFPGGFQIWPNHILNDSTRRAESKVQISKNFCAETRLTRDIARQSVKNATIIWSIIHSVAARVKKPRTENRDRDRESGPRTDTETEIEFFYVF